MSRIRTAINNNNESLTVKDTISKTDTLVNLKEAFLAAQDTLQIQKNEKDYELFIINNKDIISKIQDSISSSVNILAGDNLSYNIDSSRNELQAIAQRLFKEQIAASNTDQTLNVTKDVAAVYQNNTAGLPSNKFANTRMPVSNTDNYNPNAKNTEAIEALRRQSYAGRTYSPIDGKTKLNNANDRSNRQSAILSGSDLSVFFVSEVYNATDLANKALKEKPWLMRKELVMTELDNVMSLSYSILREVFPVRSLGIVKPKSHTRGPMTITGHLAFAIFTEDVLVRLRTQMMSQIKDMVEQSKSQLDIMNRTKASEANAAKDYSDKLEKEYNEKFFEITSEIDKIKKAKLQAELKDIKTKAQQAEENYKRIQNEYNTNNTGIDNANKELDNTSAQYEYFEQILQVGDIYLLNQLLPFNLLVMGTNEAGYFSKMMIKNVYIMDENQYQGTATPGIMNKVTFTAEDIYPMTSGTNAMVNSAKYDASSLTNKSINIYSGSDIMNTVRTMADSQLKYNLLNK